MRKTEKAVGLALRANLPRYPLQNCTQDCFIFNVENAAVDGTFDLFLQCHAGGLWVELKCPRVPQKLDAPLFKNNHGISAAQIDFGRKVARAGGRAVVLICTKEFWFAVEGVDLSREFCDQATFEQWLDVALFYVPPPKSAADWENLAYGFYDFIKNGDTGLPVYMPNRPRDAVQKPPAFLRKDAKSGI